MPRAKVKGNQHAAIEHGVGEGACLIGEQHFLASPTTENRQADQD